MKDLFFKKSLAKLRELNKKNLISTADESGINIVWFNPNFSNERKLKPNLKMHCHTFYEVHFLLDGFVTYRTKDETQFTVKEGEFLFIPPGTEHVIANESTAFKKFGLTFSYSDNETVKYIFRNEIFKADGGELVKNTFSNIAHALTLDNNAESHIVKNAVFSLILFLADKVIEKNESTLNISTDKRVARAKKFIEDNAMHDISVEEAASFVYLSAKQLGRLFKEHEHITVSDFIARCRCQRAKMLLEQNDIPLSAISEMLSFSNEYNFNRYFKRIEGVTPGAYRTVKGR